MIGAQGIKYISEALKENKALVELYLCNFGNL